MVEEGRGDELFTSKFPFPLLITAAGYIDKYGPAERYNILQVCRRAPLPCPLHLWQQGAGKRRHRVRGVAGSADGVAAMPIVAQVAVIEGADHVYTGVADELAAIASGSQKQGSVLST